MNYFEDHRTDFECPVCEAFISRVGHVREMMCPFCDTLMRKLSWLEETFNTDPVEEDYAA